MKVPIIIVSNGNPGRLTTSSLLNEIPHTVLFETQKKADDCEFILGSGAKVVITRTRSLVAMRNYVLKKLVPKNKWFIGMDDNVRGFTAVRKSFRRKHSLPTADSKSRNWRHVYNHPCSPKEYVDLLMELIIRCERIGAPLGGVATMENPYFRSGRWAYRRFVKTKMHVMKNTGDLFYKYEQCHDSFLSAQAVAKYGTVLVDNFMHYKSGIYEAGGLGTLEERKANGLEEMLEEIIDEFPGLVMRAHGPQSALRFRLVRDSSVERWRYENGYLK
jgi:hypothetical protein